MVNRYLGTHYHPEELETWPASRLEMIRAAIAAENDARSERNG